ncbi:hypothetical protein [Gilvimarinus polysaccharolyticus]|uniref:hypothetical protein n=1 Tax=Gilvimarinus polysaccharolyticus TaxID=863921 RepID=UPI00067310E9|nr:hypothetical protein [Gilvimarinus polysaccharolyticus]
MAIVKGKEWALVTVASALFAAGASAHEQTFSPESHAPAGVMADHTHAKGEIMTGYRYTYTSFNGVYQGSNEVGANELAAAGYSMMATAMSMEMTMLDIMYAPTDRLTLMLMPMYMTMSMDMDMTASDMTHDTMDMHSSMDMHMDHGHTGHMSHEVDGIGDTNLSALYKLVAKEHHTLIGTLGVNAPTGKSDLKNADGSFVHYGMQLGSGTWDATPSITYTGASDALSWGVQASALIRLEDANDSGYALGDKYAATAWGAVRVVDWMSLSARVNWSDQDSISGHYNGAHNHSSPADIQANYGGEFLDAALGVNTVVTGGNFAGLRFGLEWLTRVQEDYNGYQLGLDDSISANITYAF